MNISDAEKTVINGLTQKDESTIASTDLVQLYAQDGTPNGKISKADLMDAVKASLPALLSDGSTNGGSVLSIIDGALKTRTDANLASVLGGHPTNHALVQISNSNKTGLEIAKEYWNNMNTQVAFLLIIPSDTNVFATIYKASDGAGIGRIELHAISYGNTAIYKKSYNDNDFVLVQ